MGDNTQLGAMSGGDTIATDDIGGVKYQRVKLTLGEDGQSEGDVSSALELPVKESRLLQLLTRLLHAVLYPPWLDRSANAIRNQVQSGTVTTVTTVTTCSTLTSIGSTAYQGQMLVLGQNISAWSQACRARIS